MTPFEIPGLATKVLGRNAFRTSTTRSTQNDLKTLLPSAREGTIVLTDRQTEGRGRQGRKWISLPGDQLYFSLLLKPKGPLSDWPQLNIVAGHALANVIEVFGSIKAQVKHPNDVLLRGKKVAGILSEAMNPFLIFGVGINVSGRRSDFPKEIQDTATSIEEEIGPIDRFEILRRFLTHFEEKLGESN